MYVAFSDQKNIRKIVRVIEVFWEEITLQVMLLPWKHRPYKNCAGWWKYVSSPYSKNKRVTFLYWDSKIENSIINEIIKDLLTDKNYYPKLIRFFKNSYSNYKKITDELYKKEEKYYRNLSDNKLINIFKNYLKHVEFAAYAYYIPFDLILACNEIVKKDFKKILADESNFDIDKAFEVITTYQIDTVVKREKIQFLKRLKKIQELLKKGQKFEDRKIQKIIFRQWYDFGARIFTHVSNHNYKLNDYIKKFKKNLRLNINSELKKIVKKDEEEKILLGKILSIFKKYKNVLRYIKRLRQALNDRNYESEKVNIYYEHGIKFYKEINRRLKTIPDGHLFLSKNEIIEGLAGKIDAKKIYKERKKKGFTIKQEDDRIVVLTGVNKKDYHEDKVIGDNKVNKVIKGMSTYLGDVKGKVKVILDPDEDGVNFKKGMILVTSMTTPEFTALIKRSAAIVTDEGGLLCHAAIISREFKKPCITGTKIATQVLEDGDFVEVDADNGVVKILKRI